MMNNDHQNSDCAFGEALVAYLYDEASEHEKARFEAHLVHCGQCADELEAFSGVHFSIGDWKTRQFDGLDLPAIRIPSEKPLAEPEVSLEQGWLSGLRNLLTLSSTWSMATAALAVMAIGVGIALIALNSRQGGKDVAAGNQSSNPIAAPTIEKTPDAPAASISPSNASGNQADLKQETKNPETKASVEQNTKNARAVKISGNQRQPQRAENSPKSDDVKRSNKVNKDVPAPKIIEVDEEDDSLRLAELFDEIGTR